MAKKKSKITKKRSKTDMYTGKKRKTKATPKKPKAVVRTPKKVQKTKNTDAPVLVLNLIKKPTKTTEQGNYLSKSELMKAVMESKSLGRMSDSLAMKLQLLVARYAKKSNWSNYSFNTDMQAYAMMSLVKTWNSFNPKKSQNPFAYFSQCVKASFIQFLNQEKRQRNIRDGLLVEHGMTPSFSYQLDDNGDGVLDTDDNGNHNGDVVNDQDGYYDS